MVAVPLVRQDSELNLHVSNGSRRCAQVLLDWTHVKKYKMADSTIAFDRRIWANNLFEISRPNIQWRALSASTVNDQQLIVI